MISDTLHDAIVEIKEYLEKDSGAYKDIEPTIRGLLLNMESVQRLCEQIPSMAPDHK